MIHEFLDAFAESEIAGMLCCGIVGTCLGLVIGLAIRWSQ